MSKNLLAMSVLFFMSVTLMGGGYFLYMNYRQTIFNNDIKCQESAFHLQKFNNVISGYYNQTENICYVILKDKMPVRTDRVGFKKNVDTGDDTSTSGALDK